MPFLLMPTLKQREYAGVDCFQTLLEERGYTYQLSALPFVSQHAVLPISQLSRIRQGSGGWGGRRKDAKLF